MKPVKVSIRSTPSFDGVAYCFSPYSLAAVYSRTQRGAVSLKDVVINLPDDKSSFVDVMGATRRAREKVHAARLPWRSVKLID